jgi:hypothetical protein
MAEANAEHGLGDREQLLDDGHGIAARRAGSPGPFDRNTPSG